MRTTQSCITPLQLSQREKCNMKTGTCILTFVVLVLSSMPQSARAHEATQPKPNVSSREGQHDFDFNFGVWKTHIKRVLEPLSGSNKSIELNGLVTTHKIWDGRAQWEEIEADGPNGHWQGMTLFLYNPQAHQWNQSFINSKIGELSPPLVGEFKDGRGELFSQDTFNGRSVLVRAVWSNIEPDSHHFEESYSDDGGKTWAPAFIAELAREKSAPVASTPTTDSDANHTDNARDGAHDFDFDFGTWKTHSSRMLHPLTGSKDWAEMDGVTVVKKVWGGKANLADYKAERSEEHTSELQSRGHLVCRLLLEKKKIAHYRVLVADFPEMPEPHNNLTTLYVQKSTLALATHDLLLTPSTAPYYQLVQQYLGSTP